MLYDEKAIEIAKSDLFLLTMMEEKLIPTVQSLFKELYWVRLGYVSTEEATETLAQAIPAALQKCWTRTFGSGTSWKA